MGNNISKKNKDKPSKKEKKLKKSKKEKKEKKEKKSKKLSKSSISTEQTPRDRREESPQIEEDDQNDNFKLDEHDDPENQYRVYVNPDKRKVTNEDFELLKVVGRGSFGKVMMVKKKDDGRIFAMKILKKEFVIGRRQVEHTKAEKNVLMKLNHPFIIKLYYAFQTADKLYMILDFVNGGELFHHLRSVGYFTEERAKYYAAEIALALIHIHSLGIIYRDLKPENLLLDYTGNIIITDFGLSKQLADGETTSTYCGTADYLAPEVITGEGHGAPVDWWSLGILIYEMVTGHTPFYDDDINVMYQRIKRSNPIFPKNISYDCKSIIAALLEKNQDDRIVGEDVIRHSWFSEIDFEKLERRELTPPWIPPVTNRMETSQIDEEFTAEPVADTPPLEGGGDGTFEGFTFVQENAIGAEN